MTLSLQIRKWFTNLEVLDSRPFAEASKNITPKAQEDDKKKKRRKQDVDEGLSANIQNLSCQNAPTTRTVSLSPLMVTDGISYLVIC